MAGYLQTYQNWSQGDVSVGVTALPYVARNEEVIDIGVSGIVILTQTCDILNLRDGPEVPALVQVAGLVKVDADFVEDVRRYRMPRYMYVPAVADDNLVADLNICATYDRAILADWSRLAAPADDEAQRRVEFALSRHRSRHAFPDRWAPAFDKMKNWLRGKGGKGSEEGIFVNAIQEMRIVAEHAETPASATVILIICKTTPQDLISKWQTKMVPVLKGKIDKSWKCDVSFLIQSLADMTAEDYVGSHLLDFDALTKAANDDSLESQDRTSGPKPEQTAAKIEPKD